MKSLQHYGEVRLSQLRNYLLGFTLLDNSGSNCNTLKEGRLEVSFAQGLRKSEKQTWNWKKTEIRREELHHLTKI